MMDCKKIIRNPPLPSPWTNRAPVEYKHRCKLWTSSGTRSGKTNLRCVPQKLQILREDSLFRNLNMNTLIIAFPHISKDVIEDALTKCGNSLSETIHVLKVSNMPAKSSLTIRKVVQQSPLPQTITQQNKVKEEITYIPTKYEDVQIVEINKPFVNNDWQSTPGIPRIRVKNLRYFRNPSPISKKSIPSLHIRKIVPFLPLPITQNEGHISSEVCKVENDIEKQHHNIHSEPNHFLERTLTLYSPQI